MRGAWRSCCALLLGLVAACNPASVDLELSGIITDRQTGQPLPGARVFLLWNSGLYSYNARGTESGADGRYALSVPDVPCDSPSVTIQLAGYGDESRDVECTAQVQQLDFALSR